jgi:Protein of unknown function (DUF992)
MVRNYLLLATLALGAMFAEQATAQSWTQVGTLSCRVDPNIGFIIVGHQPMQCVYMQAPNAIPQVPPQSYDGALARSASPLGSAQEACWAGRSLHRPRAYLLARSQVSMSASRPMSVGSNRTIALQPLSLQGSTAINVIAGVSSLKLRWH